MFSSIFTPPSGPRRQCYHHTHVPAPTPADGTQPSAKIPTGEFLSRFDDFFGCAHPPVTHLPTHTARVSPEQRESVGSESVPPPYEQQADPPPAPAYGTKEEPVTLSKYLFKYGFCKSSSVCGFSGRCTYLFPISLPTILGCRCRNHLHGHSARPKRGGRQRPRSTAGRACYHATCRNPMVDSLCYRPHLPWPDYRSNSLSCKNGRLQTIAPKTFIVSPSYLSLFLTILLWFDVNDCL